MTSNQSSVGSYQYDANGNMTCRMENGEWFIQNYNAENRISSIVRLASGDCTTPGNYAFKWDFGYDGDGVRVSTAHFTGGTADSLSLYFFGGAYEITNGAVKKYYLFAGQIVAMKDDSGLKYFLTDHLGSIVTVLDASGNVLSEQRYLPFGQVREDLSSITQTDFSYTGQRSLPDTGLMDYRARFYDPYLSRFIQPDSLIPNPSNPQAFNRYSYVANRPINFNDPTGHKWDDCGERTGYACKIHMKQVGIIKAQGEKEKAASGSNSGVNGCAVITLACVTGNAVFGNLRLADFSNENGNSSLLTITPPISNTQASTGTLTNNNGIRDDIADTFYALGSGAQDLATFGDLLFVTGATAAITVGCFAGPEGCLIAAVEAEVAYNSGYNQALNWLSFASFALTATADFIDDGQFGEATATSLVTTALGSVAFDPFSSAAFNVYGSGYNHGYFNGVITIMNGGPFIKDD